MSNTIKITLTLQAESDPVKLGEAIAHLIKAVTPEEDLAEVAEEMKAQISEQLGKKGIERAVIQYPVEDEPLRQNKTYADRYPTDDAWKDNECHETF